MIAIFGLDGVLALNDHRRHFLKENPKNWKAFNDGCVDDEPNIPLIRTFNLYRYRYQHVCIFSERSEDVWAETEAWLELKDIDCRGRLFMRKSNDSRDDTIVKREMFAKLLGELDDALVSSKDIIIFEARQKFVDMWREMGLTCCQVAKGDF